MSVINIDTIKKINDIVENNKISIDTLHRQLSISILKSTLIISKLNAIKAIKKASIGYLILDKDIVKQYLYNFFLKNDNYKERCNENILTKKELINLISNNTFVVVDIETTGLNLKNDDIIELSAIKLKNGKIIDKFTSICKPRSPIKKEIEQLIGVTNDMVEHAYPSNQVVVEFLQFADNSILVGYNIGFDYNFIKECAGKENIVIEHKTFDCIPYVKKLFPNLPNYKLNSSIKALGLNELTNNSTMSTATTFTEMFLKIIDLLT